MPITIGAITESDFRNPIGLLTDCHRRIEYFLDVLHRVTLSKGGRELDDEYRRALEVSLKFFREAAPKHMADEEESLLPRMSSRGGAKLDSISQVLDRLKAEHRSLTGVHGEVDELGRWWLADDFLQPHETTRLITAIQGLQQVYAQHIVIEERDVFPLAASILLAEDLQLMANEMAARRNLELDPFRSSRSIDVNRFV